MNLPNALTILRLLLIPVFVVGMIYYGGTVRDGAPLEQYRWLAVAAFITASITDFLDGYIARRYQLTTWLGTILDPLADKLLILSALVTCTFVVIPGVGSLPPWFILLILFRDSILVVGSLIAWKYHRGDVHIIPHWSGKVATFFVLVLLCVLLLRLSFIPLEPLVYVAAFFIIFSSVVYFRRGWVFLLRPRQAVG